MLAAAALATFLAQSTPVPQQPPRTAPDPDTLVIYGRNADKALADCLEQACPPA